KAKINIYIIFAVVDFLSFQVKELSEILEKKEEVNQIYYDNSNIEQTRDLYLSKAISECQLILFLASRESIFNSERCVRELKIARNNNLQIIPVKGQDISWGDLFKLELSRELGFEFSKDSINDFCDKLYEYLKQFKRDTNLFDSEEAAVDNQRLNLKNAVHNFLNSGDFETIFYQKRSEFTKIFEKVARKEISPEEFMLNFGSILKR
ncbi:hypothetical protein LCGC14_2850140, partial [marine sediment metagenome]